jgi:S1-C subfamily serine protease
VSAARRILGALALALVVLTGVAEARTWSWLGVRIRDLSEQEMEEVSRRHGIREGYGVVVVDVMEDTPAARAGMRSGDIVVALEGRPVTDTRLLQRLIAQASVERDIRVTVLRTDGRRPLAVRLVSMPRPVAGERVAAEFGFLMRESEGTRESGVRLQSSSAPPFVTVVVRGSSAQKAGLEVGDVILQINEQPVVTRDAVQETMSDVPLDRTLRLTVLRDGRHVGLSLAGPEERPSP